MSNSFHGMFNNIYNLGKDSVEFLKQKIANEKSLEKKRYLIKVASILDLKMNFAKNTIETFWNPDNLRSIQEQGNSKGKTKLDNLLKNNKAIKVNNLGKITITNQDGDDNKPDIAKLDWPDLVSPTNFNNENMENHVINEAVKKTIGDMGLERAQAESLLNPIISAQSSKDKQKEYKKLWMSLSFVVDDLVDFLTDTAFRNGYDRNTTLAFLDFANTHNTAFKVASLLSETSVGQEQRRKYLESVARRGALKNVPAQSVATMPDEQVNSLFEKVKDNIVLIYSSGDYRIEYAKNNFTDEQLASKNIRRQDIEMALQPNANADVQKKVKRGVDDLIKENFYSIRQNWDFDDGKLATDLTNQVVNDMKEEDKTGSLHVHGKQNFTRTIKSLLKIFNLPDYHQKSSESINTYIQKLSNKRMINIIKLAKRIEKYELMNR